MFRNLPTTLWLVGATIAVAALSPVVGQVATTTPPVAPQPAPVATAAPTTLGQACEAIALGNEDAGC